MKKTLSVCVLFLALLTSCGQEAEPTLVATQTFAPPPLSVTYCDINLSDICLEGFDTDIDDKLWVLFKVDDLFFADIYIRADGPEGEILFECEHSESFLENVYCLGDPYPAGELIKLNIYSQSSNRLVAIGVFDVQYGNLPERDVIFKADATPMPESPSYPNPNSSYPNPSYPNQTPAP